MQDVGIFDNQGQEQDWDWLVANFGDIRVERAEPTKGTGSVYRVAKLQDRSGPAVQVVNVVDDSDEPMGGIRVVRHWPSAPVLPDWPAPVSVWFTRGVFGKTNENGDIGFGMGQGDFYFAPTRGASSVWVADEAGPSDLIQGLGMIGGSDHRHLDVTYRLVTGEPSPPAPPELPEQPPAPPPRNRWPKLVEKLDQVIALLEEHIE